MTRDDSGTPVGETLSPPVPLAKGIADGFPADVLWTPDAIGTLTA